MSISLKFEESYKKLNPAQKKAVDTIDGPVIVVAGPGSGKTEILSLRVANILRLTDTSPGNILCLTFTDSAAVNMRKRLSGLLGNSAYRVAIYTFHSFGTDIINSFPEHFFGGASLLPADDLATISILEKIFSELPHDNPLTSLREGAYVYLPEARSAISHLKKGGLTPEEFRTQILENKEVFAIANVLVQETFEDRLSKKNFEKIRALVASLRALDVAHEISDVRSLHLVVANSLERVMNDAEEIDKTTPLSEWKKKWTEKNDDNGNVLKGTMALPKLLALADVYEKYQEAMREEGYFDFDDMILDVIHSLRENPSLRYEIQERFQYLLVDEFQDTNDAQMRLIRLLTDAPVNESRPNIMVVGDDDQAIYKFQGADISNILSFREIFRDPAVITMTENYRSVQKVLDLAREVIVKGEERLENKIPEMEKILTAGNKSLGEGAIHHENFETSLHEMSFVAAEIRRLIDSGTPASDIAVITSKHRILESLVPFLSMQNVPVNYDRKQNVLEEPHVRELITMTRFIASLGRKNNDEADEFLPEILSYPFWNIPRKTIWEISVHAKYKSWLGIMMESEDRKLRDIAEFFIDLGIRSQHETLEQILDELMGSDIVSVAFTEDDDLDGQQAKSNKQKGDDENGKFTSPFKEYYFSREKFEKNRAVFLLFLSSLRTFVQALREHKQGALLSVDDLLSFVELHDKSKIQVTDKSPFVSGKDSVTLISAHKAKGMEFDTVFVLSCQDDVWAGRPKSSLLSFPKNLPLAPAGNTLDDHLRLFYVAITRAKRHLYLTSYHTKENGKESLPLQFLVSATDEEKATSNKQQATSKKDENLLFSSWKAVLTPPFVADEEELLKTLLEEYQMSVTHLNNFLDITHGGPQTFLEHNLLRFPSAKIPSGAYGSAMHHTIESIYTFLKREGDLPLDEMILGWFEKELKHERLSLQDHTYFLKKGKDALTVYLKEKKESFELTHKIETDFAHQGVILGEARITGKIDKMIPEGDSVKVVDFKTGKSFSEWDKGTPEEKIKLYKYRRQLIFYKLLVENSRDYGKFTVDEGTLEFLEPDKKGHICELVADITNEETIRTKALIEAVYKKIINLDLPDISQYPQDMNGIRQFEDDLL
ncbi:MAG: ATP-dependent DNA helicase [Candidatus Parcubacteria bacterium]|nr:ATP-dependent DNA helicase [Candidatus Parcubacteria bacterium]